ATMCQEEGLKPLELIKWIYRAIDKFCLLADVSPKVPNLKKKKYGDFSIAPAEWELLELVHNVLQVRLAKLQKYSMAIDQTDIFFVCLALEPSIKLEYTKQNW
ncbi:hypothetical protein L208DRAFT_996808, partial [Tricholoma matsutake]